MVKLAPMDNHLPDSRIKLARLNEEANSPRVLPLSGPELKIYEVPATAVATGVTRNHTFPAIVLQMPSRHYAVPIHYQVQANTENVYASNLIVEGANTLNLPTNILVERDTVVVHHTQKIDDQRQALRVLMDQHNLSTVDSVQSAADAVTENLVSENASETLPAAAHSSAQASAVNPGETVTAPTTLPETKKLPAEAQSEHPFMQYLTNAT